VERVDVVEEAVMASVLAVSYLQRLKGRMKSPAGLFHVHDLILSAALSEGFSQKGGQPNSTSGRVLWLVPRPVVERIVEGYRAMIRARLCSAVFPDLLKVLVSGCKTFFCRKLAVRPQIDETNIGLLTN
jgi:hypothetical protein